jgi:hypothetical protein
VTVGPDLTHNGNLDAFVARVNPAGTGLAYCGYVGGVSTDVGYGIDVDGSGNAYVTGFTSSAETSFPVTVGPDLTFNGGEDAFVARINAAGTGLDYCGYIGGDSVDEATGIAIDMGGNAYVVGATVSTEGTFPVTGGPDLTFNGESDVFVAKVGGISGIPPVVSVEATDPNAAESGPDPGLFTISRTGTIGTLTVNFSVGGTAMEGGDYATLGGSVTFPDAQMSATVTVTPALDSRTEGNETVILTLASGIGYTIGTPATATVTIADYRGGMLQVARRVNFGKAKVPPVGPRPSDSTSRDKTLLVRNRSPRDNLIVTVGDPSPSPPFSLVDGGGTVVIGPRGSHEVSLRFAPAVKGRSSGSLNIASSDPRKPTVDVGLTGSGR